MPFGNLIAGALAQALSVSFAVMSGGIICTAFFVVINIAYPQIRQM
jgi:hypothetical protein